MFNKNKEYYALSHLQLVKRYYLNSIYREQFHEST